MASISRGLGNQQTDDAQYDRSADTAEPTSSERFQHTCKRDIVREPVSRQSDRLQHARENTSVDAVGRSRIPGIG